MPTAPEYANERGGTVVEAVACRTCHAPRGLRCVVRGQSLSGKVAPQIHLKRQLDYESVAPKQTAPGRRAPKLARNGSGLPIEDVLQVVREAWRDAVGREMTADDFDALRAAAADGSPVHDSHDDSQSDDSQAESADLLVNWLAVPVRWSDLDKKVYDHIVALQSDSKLQAVPLDQKEMAALFKYGPRKVNESIAKLKSAGAINVKRQRGPSLYSASSEIPRWPVRIAGGIGTPSVEDSHVDDSQPEDSQMPAGPDIEINQSHHILEDLYIPGPAGMPILSHDSQPDDSQTRPTATCERCGPNSLVESWHAGRQGLHGLYHCAGQKSTCSYLYDAEIGVVLRPAYIDELSIPDAIDLCRRSREAHAGRWPAPPVNVNADAPESGNADERFAEYREDKQRYDREVNNG